MKDFLKNIIYQTDGPYTRELVLADAPLGLGRLPQRLLPDEIRRSVCGYCSTGCSLDVHLKDGRPVNLTPTQRYPVNFGEACPKGWEALSPLQAPDRAVMPLLKNEKGQLEPVDWETALVKFVDRFKAIQDAHGKDSVAFLSTGQITTEEMALLGSLAKFGMGMIHGDGNTRQCMATAVTAYKESFGFDAPPYTYKDFEESDVLVFVGANPCIAHPLMWKRVVMNRHNPEIIVVDPRRTETATAATRHYAITPKSDLILFYALAHILIKKNWVDQTFIDQHTSGFKDFAQHVKFYSPEKVSSLCGLSCKEIEELASLIHNGRRVSFWWTMGVNQSHQGTRTAQALINLALMTGNIGRPGTGANSITGQCNAMGSRLFSNTTNLLGGRDFADSKHRMDVASILNIDPDLIPSQRSWAYDQIVEGIVQGKIKGLWIIATNPLHSWINRNELQQYLGDLEFLVVQDMYHTTETAQMADLVLPAAGWGEKDGTFINSERRFGRIRKSAQAPGQALADFYIFKLIAEYWGCGRMFQDWTTPEDVLQILKKVSEGRPCDISGIKDYQMIDDCGGIQWPFPQGSEVCESERRLFEDGKFFHQDQKARFIFEQEKSEPEPAGGEYPLILLTGRGTSAQWHTQTRTAKSELLKKMYPKDVYVEINPEDARQRKISQHAWVYVTTRRDTVKARAFIIPTVKAGQIFMSMHYPETNRLTFPSFDPYSRQPSYKNCAVDVRKDLYR